MSIVTTVAASTRWLTTVEHVLLDLDGATIDTGLLEQLIGQASAAIERACGRIFAQQSYTETLPLYRSETLELRYTPVVGVTSVTVGGELLDAADYRIDAEAGLLRRTNGWWWLGAGVTHDIVVVYTAGYILPEQTAAPVPLGPTLPLDLERAAIEAVKIWQHELNPDSRVTSKVFGLTGDRIEFHIAASRGSLPPMTESLIAPWQRMVLR